MGGLHFNNFKGQALLVLRKLFFNDVSDSKKYILNSQAAYPLIIVHVNLLSFPLRTVIIYKGVLYE